MRLEENVADAITRAILDRLGEGVEDVKIEISENWDGEIALNVSVFLAEDADIDRIAKRYFGLTRRVREAMGEDLQDVFPVIRPMAVVHA